MEEIQLLPLWCDENDINHQEKKKATQGKKVFKYKYLNCCL